MRRRYGPLLVIAVAAALALTTLTACGSSSSEGGANTNPTATTTTQPQGPPLVMLRKTKLGPTLVDASGHTLYVWDVDPDGETTCISGLCAASWPALYSKTKNVVVGRGLDPGLFSTIPGLHGTRVVAVRRRPLYRSVRDLRPGSVIGQGDGEVWHAVDDQGDPIVS